MSVIRIAAALTLLLLPFVQALAQESKAQLDPDRIAKAAGVNAAVTGDGVIRIGWSRVDVPVKVDGVPLNPFAGLGSWAAFKATSNGAMLMGDTVVFEDEVAPAMDAAFSHELEITALHNHFFYSEPPAYFMHIVGHGQPEKLAAGVKAVWDKIKSVRTSHPAPARRFSGDTPRLGVIDAKIVEQIVGSKPDVKDGIVKVSIPREGKMHGTVVGGSMGLTTWAAFSGADNLAAVDGDFIMTASEVQPVMHALRQADIYIVALHNHMIGEEPPFYFLHFWGKGTVRQLATGIRAALDAQGG